MTDMQKRPLGAQELTLALRAFEGEGQPRNGFAEIDRLAARTIGHRLCTVMLLHRASMQVERVYSSRPDAYPAGGRKHKRDTRWGRRVLENAEPFIGRDATDIRANFDDHEKIAAMDLESVLNLPIVYGGRVLGTLNLLAGRGHYTEADIEPGRLLAAALLPALCLLQDPPGRG